MAMSADKSINLNELPKPEKPIHTQQAEEFIQIKSNLEKEDDEQREYSGTDSDQEIKR
jgi:hypothetical protein